MPEARDLASYMFVVMVAERSARETASVEAPRSSRWFDHVTPGIALGILFCGLLVILLGHYDRTTGLNHGSVVVPGVVMLAFAGLQAKRRSWDAALVLVVEWAPIIACFWVYENLHDLTMLIRPDQVDASLAALDAKLLGAQPTIALEPLVHPVLTDYLALCYTSYFFVPALFAGWLWIRGHRDEFRQFQLFVLLVCYLGFIGYVCVPARGPRYELASQYTVHLQGTYYNWVDHLMNGINPVATDCFPSLHTAVSTTWLICAYRWRRFLPAPRITLPALAVITVSLWFSTVYLRYHWVVDVLAGWVLAFAVQSIGRWLHTHWPRSERRA